MAISGSEYIVHVAQYRKYAVVCIRMHVHIMINPVPRPTSRREELEVGAGNIGTQRDVKRVHHSNAYA